MFDKVKIRAMAAPWRKSVEVLVTDGRDSFGVSVTMQKVEGESYPSPTITISNDAAQTLMDDLWAAGFKPTEGTGSAGALSAVENHLKDLRLIVFNKLKIDP